MSNSVLAAPDGARRPCSRLAMDILGGKLVTPAVFIERHLDPLKRLATVVIETPQEQARHQ